MSNQVTVECKAYKPNKKSCVICRDNDKTQMLVILAPGHEYQKCMPLTLAAEQNETGLCVVEPMTSKDQEIAGVNMCYQNLTDSKEVCETKLLKCALFDSNMICWPEDFTLEDIKRIESKSVKPGFCPREECLGLPDWLQEEETAEVKK